MNDQWQVKVAENIGTKENDVYLFRDGYHGREFVTHEAKIMSVKIGEQFDSSSCYFARMTDEQLQAFADALANKGVKTTNDHKNEGLLEATSKHLEDMRSLVFTKVSRRAPRKNR